MGLTKGITKQLPVPGEDGASITIRMLSWLTLDEARRKRLASLGDEAKAFGALKDWAAAPAAGPSAEPTLEELAATDRAKRLAGYDRATVLRHGIVAWSYGDTIDIEELDEPTAEWAHLAILELSLPTESAAKKDSSRSTGS